MNTTSGHQTHTIEWHSDNWLWSIECCTVYARSGEVERQTYKIYNQRQGVMWPINAETAANDFYPKYVRAAIARHVPQEA